MDEGSDYQNITNIFTYVQALYSYSYTDDVGVDVTMTAGETYRLLSKGSEWWRVKRLDSSPTFYVPSTYVRVLDDEEESEESPDEHEEAETGNDNTCTPDAGKTQQQQHSSCSSVNNEIGTLQKPSMDTANYGEDSLYQNFVDPYGDGGDDGAFKVQQFKGKSVRADSQDDYVNLEDYRKQSGLPTLNSAPNVSPKQPGSPGSPSSPESESDYANFRMVDPPLPDNAVFKRTLLETWDMFLDPVTNRIFYVNKETQDRTWKPPRDKNLPGTFHYEKQRSRSSGEYEEVLDSSTFTAFQNRKSRSVDYGRPTLKPYFESNPLPVGWRSSMTDDGEDVFVNEITNEKWSSARDEFGRLYYYRESAGGVESLWQLPAMKDKHPNKTNGDVTEKVVSAPVNPGITQQAESASGFGPGRKGSGHQADAQPPKSLSQSIQLNEPIEGMLNKIKLEKGKKVSKKWSQTYVKLSGSNLVFYKDAKSSQAKPGAPFGKYEQMISLMTVRVELNPREFTNKKNVMLITSPECQILLQCDDLVKIQEWNVKLQNKIREVGGPPEEEPHDIPEGQAQPKLLPPEDLPGVKKKPSFKKKHNRSPSEQGAVERDKEKGRIKDVLLNFLNKRQKIQQLEAKGIYKDAVFGSELKQLCDREKQKVPSFVQRAITAIEKRGLNHEGIYRLSGNMATIQKLRCMVDQGDGYDLDDPMFDVHVLTGALKLFFRELKEPLFTFLLFDKFLKAILKDTNAERLKLMKSTVSELPKNHYETMKLFFKHLMRVMELSSENKMQAQNIAIVMGPTLIWPQEPSLNLTTTMVYQGRIVEYILLEFKNIFR